MRYAREMTIDMGMGSDSPASALKKAGQGENRESPEPAIIPLCDVAGYSCFVAWAFIVGWDAAAVPAGFVDDKGCFLLRAVLFAGVALGALALFLTGRLSIAKSKVIHGIVPCVLCLCPALTLFIPLGCELIFPLWLLGGFGQAGFFLVWGSRFRVLDRRQQLHAVSDAFIFGGLALALSPFADQSIVNLVVATLPLLSLVFLVFAWRRWAGDDARPDQKPQTDLKCATLRKQIPFQEDRRLILLKGLFGLLYSITLGFATCAVLSNSFQPANEVVIGLSNVVAAFAMVVVLRRRERERKACDVLPKLFLGTTCICCFAFGILWPAKEVLAFAAALFILFGCYEILSARTAYVYSEYDIVRCLWEINSAKTGNSIGFFLGWTVAVLTLNRFNADPSSLVVVCFSLVAFSAVVDTTFFKDMKTEFREILVDDEPMLEIFDAKLAEPLVDGKGRWGKTCEDLSEKYKLSPRQKEIFVLLAKGRNVQFIKDKLVLSTPTVKSHVYSIYQKMGIHSHQELLDLVEAESKSRKS